MNKGDHLSSLVNDAELLHLNEEKPLRLLILYAGETGKISMYIDI